MATVAINPLPDGNLAFEAPYKAAAVDALKAQIPATDRQWDKTTKRWVVLPGHVHVLVNLAQQYYNVKLTPPQFRNCKIVDGPQIRLFAVRYLGRAKTRTSGEESAFGWVDGSWKLIFPKQVLLDWFGIERRPGEALTLYNVLAVKPDAPGSEIKTSWRRLIRQWHPDVSREPDAADQFHAIQGAYEVLSDPARRARYDAGLALERSMPRSVIANNTPPREEYRAPLTCGYLMVEGQEQLGRFVVSKVLEWQDIKRDDGAILVTSWPEGADNFQERWVKA